MPDYGARYTDKEISRVERELHGVYQQAKEELEDKLDEFYQKHKARDRMKRKQLAEGKITRQEYQDWMNGQIFQREQWKRQIKQINHVLYDTNSQAVKIVNERRLDVFAENYNYFAYLGEQNPGISFELYDARSVARLIREHPQILPEWKIDEEKDYIWNAKKVNNIVTQGIIQGEGIGEIAQRLSRDLSSQNENKMRMFARTAMTGAQNAGRQRCMEDTANMGVETHKKWVATHDKRTRDSHRHLDGQEVPYNESFMSDHGEIRYPGDTEADPAEVFNCRCTMVTIFPKYEDYSRKYGEGVTIDGQSYEEWKKGKKARGEVQPEINVPSYYAPIEEMSGMDDKQREAINKRFMELDKKYHANVDGGVHGLLERDQAEYDLQFKNYKEHLLEENPRMRESTAEKRTKEIMGERPEYIPGHGSLRYMETGGEYRDRDNLYTMTENADNWQDFRHTITINPYSLGADTTLADDIADRRAFIERNAQRLEEGRTLRSRSNVGMSLEGTFIHEYGHAIDYAYGVTEHPLFREFYEILTEDEIRSVSRYAETNEREFMAEAFYESFMGDTQGDVSKRFMKVLEEIINDKH